MGKYNYLVFGAGRQGIAVVVDLIKNCEAKTITVIDPNEKQLLKCTAKILELFGGKESTVINFLQEIEIDACDMILPYDYFDIILSCAPYKSNMEIMKFAVKSNIPYCDLGGNPKVVQEQRLWCESSDLDNFCPPVVVDCGVSPGISNILGVHLAKQGYDIIRIRCGGIFDGFAQGNSLNYELLFSPEGLISEYSGKSPMIISGELVMEDTISCIEPFLHDRLPSDIMSRKIEFESAHTSNNSVETIEYLQSVGVKHYDYQTIRDIGHWNIVRQWKMLGYCRGDQKKDEELIEILKNDESLERRHQDILFLMVRAAKSGHLLSEQKELTLMHFGDPEGFSAMEELTAWGITLIAYHMVSGLGKPEGFSTPEMFIDGEWMIQQLESRLK